MPRARVRWSPQWLQVLQSPQAPYWQSTFSRPLGQASVLQSSVSLRDPSQPWPPPWGSTATRRRRKRWPPPQLASQVLHSSQCARAQSTSAPISGHSSRYWHSLLSASGPRQGRPSPCPRRATSRERSRLPRQDLLLYCRHLLQSDQSSSSQSSGSTQGSSPQLDTSRATPSAGLPQPSPAGMLVLLRACRPPPQLREQGVQGPQPAHWPSLHFSSSQDCVPHGSTCSVSEGAHGAPPARAPRSGSRRRVLSPPPHVAGQGDQSCQSAQVQSAFPQEGRSSQAATSARASSQASPPPRGRLSTSRLRERTPEPQLLEQGSKEDQAPTTQPEWASQGCVLQGSVFMRLSGQLLPPFSG
mmetsp:Transcript_15234/g.46902  ORF Transcript_15234/g.46902 Transcript_15234/m.46902 type:complete len:357 (-) Transcript_15234:230-1300(-)